MKLSDIFSVLTADEYMIASKGVALPGDTDDDNYVVVYAKDDFTEHGMHSIKRVYEVLPDGDLKEIPFRKMVDEVKAAIAPKVSVEELLEQVLTTSGPTPVIRVHEIISKHPEVVKDIKPKKGCLYLEIPNPGPGKQPEHLYVRF